MKIRFFKTYDFMVNSEKLEGDVNDFLKDHEIIDIKQSFSKDEYDNRFYFVMVLYK